MERSGKTHIRWLWITWHLMIDLLLNNSVMRIISWVVLFELLAIINFVLKLLHVRVKHLNHFIWFWSKLLVVLLQHLGGSLRCLLYYVLRGVWFDEAMLGLKYSTGVLVVYLVLVSWDFNRGSKLLRLHLVMILDWWWVVQVDQIILICIFNGQVAITSARQVHPLQSSSDCSWWCVQIYPLFRLRVEESVAKQQLLTFEVLVFLRNIVPADRHWPNVTSRESLLVLTQLPNESYSYL